MCRSAKFSWFASVGANCARLSKGSVAFPSGDIPDVRSVDMKDGKMM